MTQFVSVRSFSTHARASLFYGAMAIILVLIVTKTLPYLLPGGLATQVGHNSESFALVLLVCPFIQWGQSLARRSSVPWILPSAIAVSCFTLSYLLDTANFPTALATLNEPVLAAGVLVLYVMLPRPRRWYPWLALGVAVLITVFYSSNFVTNQAESLVALALAPISFDLADRTILHKEEDDNPTWRAAWCISLIVAWLAFLGLKHIELPSYLSQFIFYNARASEAYLGILLIHVYFSYILGERWRKATDTSA